MMATDAQPRPSGQEKVAQALRRLEEGTGAILDSDSFRRYLQVMSRFHSYSWGNVMLIHAQMPTATRVAGYRRWQELHRQVRKGEKGLLILAPVTRKIGDEEDEPSRAVVGFKAAHVFDVTQSDGEDLPEPPAAEAIKASTEPGQELYRRLLDLAGKLGLTVRIGDTGEAHGVYSPATGTITLHERIVGTDHAPKTLSHEIGHHLAEHRGWSQKEDAESVAEGAAFVVTSHYGIDSSSYSFGYVAGWAQDRPILKRNLGAIQKVASEIISTLEGGSSEKEHAEHG